MNLNSYRMPQSKAIQCYLLMSLWIVLIIFGVYKFIEPQQKSPDTTLNPIQSFSTLESDGKTRRIFRICNFPEDMAPGDEGVLNKNKWQLKGLLILIRHGDRGPLQHVKKISSIDCGMGAEKSDLLALYKGYLHNQSLTGRSSWAGPGPFHSFPFIPSHPTQCHLGQLTMQGVLQLLKLGVMLKESYSEVWEKLTSLNSNDIVVYSTRYRRTFQSALSFLFGLIPHETLEKISIQESQSMSFCFKDCGCPVTEKLARSVQKVISHQLHSHPAVAALSAATGRLLFAREGSTPSADPYSVRDALLSVVCHDGAMPCETPTDCMRRQNVVGIFSYTDWASYRKWRNSSWKRYCLLKSYGLMRHIVQQMLRMVSNSGPYLVLYSGHDHTLEQLSAALGLQNDPFLLRYAARLAIEVYQETAESDGARGVYFRVLSNGRDVTRQIAFCKGFVDVNAKTSLCKIEDIVRFLHDDYFASLNVTNFKDACTH